ncbi:MAG: 3-phosphoshikimate 1-carboxyvinyltransferase [Acidimicrobiaceae bacterium]|nr:3-phosphoshikimate 1-carboxyvinyltransferase [Acidimicrobiaceae bacterium]
MSDRHGVGASEGGSVEVIEVEGLSRPPDATVRVPGSKSITNRALVCAALAEGESHLSGALFADDTWAMVGALRALGAEIETDEAARTMLVRGRTRTQVVAAEVDARQSGTTGRFAVALAALGAGPVLVDGDPQLRRRPFASLLEALAALGAEVSEHGTPGGLPVSVRGPLRGGRVSLSGDVSSQYLSALLLAGPAMPRGLEVALTSPLVSSSYVAMTAAVMRAFGGGEVRRMGGTGEVGEVLSVAPGHYRPTDYAIEPDASAASYFFAAAAITAGRVGVDGLGVGSLQGDLAFVDLLEKMGARVERSASRTVVTGTGRLSGIDADMSDCSDTAPTLAAVAAFAETPTRVHGIGFIREKESDRIGSVVTELRRAGIEATEEPDGFTVQPGRPRYARLRTYGDHRLAMSFALLGLGADGMEIEDPECVAKTFPGYFDELAALGRSTGS